jgi:acyl-coenzyme A synthetase/AMP-(fatty) acid ligase
MATAPSLLDLFQRTVKRNPQAPAFIGHGAIVTFRQVHGLVNALARHLQQQGIEQGHVVGLAMDFSPLHPLAILALARLGALSVPILPTLPAAARQDLVRRFGIGAVVSSFDQMADSGAPLIPIKDITATDQDADHDVSEYRPDASTPLRLFLTSGTTGQPHGILHTHGSIITRMGNTLFDIDKNSRMIPSDLHVQGGMVLALGTLLAGGTLVFPRSYDFPDLGQAINLYGATHWLMTPAAITAIANALPNHGASFPGIKHLRLVGSTPSKALVAKVRTKCTPNVFVPYAMSETGVVTMATPQILAREPESSGRLQSWARLEVVDDKDQLMPLGSVGHLRVATTGMPTGYWRDEAASAKKFRQGWFYPGDLGHVSADGLLYVQGRSDDVMNLGGYKFAPETVEKVIMSHPAVIDAGVFLGHDDANMPRLLAAVVLRPGESIETLPDHCQEQLLHLTPERYIQVPAMPRNASGKLQRNQIEPLVVNVLKAMAQAVENAP